MLEPTVSDVMTRDVQTLSPDTTLADAARVLERHELTGAPVVDDRGHILGVLSLSDLQPQGGPNHGGYPMFYRAADWALIQRPDLDAVPDGTVGDAMSPFVLSIETSAHLTEAANRMIVESVHRLLVRKDTALVGVITSIDLLRGFVQSRVTAADRHPAEAAPRRELEPTAS